MLSPIEAAELANRLNPSRQSIAQKVEFYPTRGQEFARVRDEKFEDGSDARWHVRVFLNYSQTKFGEKLNVNIPVSLGSVCVGAVD